MQLAMIETNLYDSKLCMFKTARYCKAYLHLLLSECCPAIEPYLSFSGS